MKEIKYFFAQQFSEQNWEVAVNDTVNNEVIVVSEYYDDEESADAFAQRLNLVVNQIGKTMLEQQRWNFAAKALNGCIVNYQDVGIAAHASRKLADALIKELKDNPL